eukprot:TRINITY_DN24391_c0_g2_i1.p1 TRINITY_DN24391_c0_g2~~TRINITY_DN24391_c0_g2_i1.p1  ORF type:complete len:153 (+),score=39.32 TRINITY_DN24391_c0_g2_i1:55-513(+)
MCIRDRYQRLPGVLDSQVGYIGGSKADPTYQEVCTGRTNHAEAVQVTYDPKVVTYKELLDVFWGKHDPTTKDRQGNDVGTQYRSAIFYHSEEQKREAEESLKAWQPKFSSPIVTEIIPASTFYSAEEYHQRYLEKKGQSAAKGCKDKIRCYG